MPFGQDGALRAAPAAADFSTTGQYRAVKLTSDGYALCGAADLDFAGILQDDPLAGETATVKVRDVSKAVAGAAIALTDELTTDANGRMVPAATTNPIMGRPQEVAAAAGDLFAMEIRPGGTKP